MTATHLTNVHIFDGVGQSAATTVTIEGKFTPGTRRRAWTALLPDEAQAGNHGAGIVVPLG
jgi:hypothetical protein